MRKVGKQEDYCFRRLPALGSKTSNFVTFVLLPSLEWGLTKVLCEQEAGMRPENKKKK